MRIEKITTDFMESNCYILFDKNKKGMLIDPGGNSESIKQKIEELDVELKHIINTHGHIDHIFSDGDFYSSVERNELLPVLIHKLDIPYLQDSSKNLSSMLGVALKIENPIRELKDGEIIELNDLSLEIIHTPGHTPGSICLKCDEILFTGDTLFHKGVGRTDFPGSSFEKLKDSVQKKLFTLEGEIKIYPGHGPVSTINYEKKNNPFFSNTL